MEEEKVVRASAVEGKYPIRMFNSLSREVEPFIPLDDSDEVQMFVCGPTVYGEAHIGNARTFTSFDFIARYLRYRGYNVDYVMNITDIDDKIIAQARQEGVSWDVISKKYDEIFRQDMGSLGNTGVTEYVPATDHIDHIVEQVQILLDKEVAYELDDGIYFSVEGFEHYGELSGRTELNEQSQSRVDENSDKKDPRDFCLWKYSKPGEPVWETAIGSGRPGWHIEDTAISIDRFGAQYTLHGGAIDLQHPHHDAEIAIAESVTGKRPFVKYWMHAGFLTTDTGGKMSKSKGHILRVREALSQVSGRLIRFWYLSGHYRMPLKYNDQSFVSAKGALGRIDNFVQATKRRSGEAIPGEVELVQELREQVLGALDDDFNTPQAYAAFFDFISERNNDNLSGSETLKFFKEVNEFLGIFKFEDEEDDEIQALVDKRHELRVSQQYDEADEVAKELQDRGIVLKDYRDHTEWSRST